MTSATVQETKKPLTLKEISQLGYVQKSKEVLDGVTVTLQTLSISRQQKILSLLPAETTDALAKFSQLQVETLAQSTLAINDEKYTEADVDRLREWYGSLQARVLQEFYSVYQELVDEQEKVLGSLKKT